MRCCAPACRPPGSLPPRWPRWRCASSRAATRPCARRCWRPSTTITALGAGPILSLLGASVTVSSAGLLGNLALVIALPLAAGVALRTVWTPRDDSAIRLVTVLALLLLLWQVASEISLTSAYVAVIVALVVYVAGSAALGWVLALRAPAGQAPAVLLPVAMRDFAVAAGIATAAFGPAAAAPLGAYGVLVLLAGSLAAIIARRRSAPDAVRSRD